MKTKTILLGLLTCALISCTKEEIEEIESPKVEEEVDYYYVRYEKYNHLDVTDFTNYSLVLDELVTEGESSKGEITLNSDQFRVAPLDNGLNDYSAMGSLLPSPVEYIKIGIERGDSVSFEFPYGREAITGFGQPEYRLEIRTEYEGEEGIHLAYSAVNFTTPEEVVNYEVEGEFKYSTKEGKVYWTLINNK